MILSVGVQEFAGGTLRGDKGVVDVECKVVEYGLVGFVKLGLEDGDDPPRNAVE